MAGMARAVREKRVMGSPQSWGGLQNRWILAEGLGRGKCGRGAGWGDSLLGVWPRAIPAGATRRGGGRYGGCSLDVGICSREHHSENEIQVIHKEDTMVTNVPVTEHGTPLVPPLAAD